MKKALTLILIYMLLQLATGLLASSAVALGVAYSTALPLSLLLSIAIMALFLKLTGNINTQSKTWKLPAFPVIVEVIGCGLSSIWLLDLVITHLHLPDLMEEQFDIIQSGWLGILSITVFGPILEELLFRGAATSILLEKYKPSVAIVLSALLFGIFHINPVQVVGAFLIGLLLAWIFYRTGNLLCCIVLHVINNSLSVCFSSLFPEKESLADTLPSPVYEILTIVIIVILVITLLLLHKQTKSSLSGEVQ